MKNLPKISCLCVTNDRVQLLKTAIGCFKDQTYQNKELLIVYLSSDSSTASFLSELEDENINIIKVDCNEITLGDLRNIAIEKSQGYYICNWDDDDWYHPERLEIQVQEMKRNGKRASILHYMLMHDRNRKKSYVTHRRNWENSFMCERSVIEEHSIRYPSLQKGEDTPFIEDLKKTGVLLPIIRPQLYIYCYTGLNTCNRIHFTTLFRYGETLSNSNSEMIENILSQNICNAEAGKILNSREFLSELVYD